MNKKKTTKKTPRTKKPKTVTRKFLNDLADSIYNPQTKQYINLCSGKLSNGPDKDNQCDPTRTMHCGLGELYFAMTGNHAHRYGEGGMDYVSEDGVIQLAVDRSSIILENEKALNRYKRAMSKLARPKFINNSVVNQSIAEMLSEFEPSDDATLEKFTYILSNVPSVNDDSDSYRDRSRKVAAIFRKAAKLLPV